MSLFDAFSYRSKRALVVGGATGMGAAVAEFVRDAGAEVVVMDRAKLVSQPEMWGSGSPRLLERERSQAFRRSRGCYFARWQTSWQAGIAVDTLFQREERRLATCEPTDVRMPLPRTEPCSRGRWR